MDLFPRSAVERSLGGCSFLEIFFLHKGHGPSSHHGEGSLANPTQVSIAATTAIAVIPAVSARRILGPKLTDCQPSDPKRVSSSAVHPPSGPTARYTDGFSMTDCCNPDCMAAYKVVDRSCSASNRLNPGGAGLIFTAAF